jgi:hypothetical protein
MKKYPLIGFSIIAVVLLILTSFSNVIGFQTVQSSNQQINKEKVNQRELLFQTIVDIANNKEIQRIILKSQISRGGFFNQDVRFSVFNTPVLINNQLKQMYLIGLMLSKIISKSRIHSMVERHQVINLGMQKEINAIIERDATLKTEITQLSDEDCGCNNDLELRYNFPILCAFLAIFYIIAIFLEMMHTYIPLNIMYSLGYIFNCDWYPFGNI